VLARLNHIACFIANANHSVMRGLKESFEILRGLPKAELLWASVREVLNVFQAAACRCHIVTVPHDILKKLVELGGKDLDDVSLDTVRLFHRDAVAAGFKL
jgi:transaldolase